MLAGMKLASYSGVITLTMFCRVRSPADASLVVSRPLNPRYTLRSRGCSRCVS
jgi:hypothetical protein